MPEFSQRSLIKLSTCDERLQEVLKIAIDTMDFTVLAGHRGREAQEKAFREGKSKARFGQSRHNSEPSMAVDIAPYPIDWEDKVRFHDLAHFCMGIGAALGIKLKWGGTFGSFFDGPHLEIDGD